MNAVHPDRDSLGTSCGADLLERNGRSSRLAVPHPSGLEQPKAARCQIMIVLV